jgi:16S rRNA (guanine527-N7)-methyltransferase
MVHFSLPVQQIELLAGPVTERQRKLLQSYGEALLETSERVNIMSRRSTVDLAEHFVDSAALLSFCEVSGLSVGDLGSGAGLPGVVVSVLRPEAAVTLVESRRKKVVFLKRVARELGLGNLRVSHARIEDLAGSVAFDYAVARSLGAVDEVLPGCLKLVAPGGALALYKGPRWEGEARGAAKVAEAEGFGIARTEAVLLPGLERATTFVEFRRL